MRASIAGVGAVTLAAVLTAPAAATENSTADPGRTVSYRGHSLVVPADWPVIDLTADPAECVRFDRNAVYLGTPGREQRCSARQHPTTDAVLIEPVGDRTRVTVAGPRYAALATRVEQVPEQPAVRTVQPGVYTGLAFDACAAPSQGTMDAWLGSPFRGIGVYIGGIHRACAQPNLTSSWVATQTGNGWRLIPTYVGLQAPCTSFQHRVDLDVAVARKQGRDAAVDAMSAAGALGLAAGTVIYNDMEQYNVEDGPCSAAVMAFLSGWTDQLREGGYKSGVYSSGSAGITDLVRNHGNQAHSMPDHVWFAWWNGVADADGGRYLPADKWAGARIHQFLGGHDETHNGVLINIDSNYMEIR
jgi:Rv2525c-like, glycoside hydrolase-like domain